MTDATPQPTSEATAETYKLLQESWNFHVGYGAKLIVLYLAVNGAVLKFMLDTGASRGMFYVLGLAGLLFCIWCHFVCKVHQAAVREIEDNLALAASAVGIAAHPGNRRHYEKFLTLCIGFNLLIVLSFVVIMFAVGPKSLGA